MGDIIKIDPSEMPEDSRRTRPEFDAVSKLQVGEAIKFPCTWNHAVITVGGKRIRETCNGVTGVYIRGRNIDRLEGETKSRFKALCRGKWVYVYRKV
jgi:hypothetical protein